MRIPKGWVSPLSREIVEALCKKKFIELRTSQEELTEAVYELILDELMVEDKLNKEVRELLKKYDMEIEKSHLDYRKLFDLTKQKIVKERNIIL
jgi:hypothetical protein